MGERVAGCLHRLTVLTVCHGGRSVACREVYAGEAPFTFDPQGAIKRNPLFPMYPAHRAPPPAVGDLIDRCVLAAAESSRARHTCVNSATPPFLLRQTSRRRCMSVEPRMRPHASEVLDILGRHSPST